MNTTSSSESHRYLLKIERKIVDKLGLKLYDKVSAVVAELIANAYDADADYVLVNAPLGRALAVKNGDSVDDKGYVIEVLDDGHGMTPEEANSFYLRVGRDRREDPKQGDSSRDKKRPVMGRKGIGKLAPFGVCKTIEVRSAGGPKTDKGYLVTHFELDYDKIISETSEDKSDYDYHPLPLADDGKFDKSHGTLIRLKNFLPRKVPDKETFTRQLAYRFLPLPDFVIEVEDTKKDNPEPAFKIEPRDIPLQDGTKLVVDSIPVVTDEGKKLKINGWLGMSKESHKNVEFAGVRIYARGKIAAITRDFDSPAGFTGEFVARSYLVGELMADWLDESEDLIQTHRQDILWSTELGQALSKWGQERMKEVAKRGKEPRRQLVRNLFLEKSDLNRIAKERFEDPELEAAATELGEQIGAFASEDELNDEEYVAGLREIILTVAPHKLLVDTFRRIEQMAVDGKVNLAELVKLFSTSKIAQLASYGQVVDEKLKAIDLLEKLIREDGTPENDFQHILENAPWLIDPQWIPISSNQALTTFRSAFVAWYKKDKNVELLTTTDIEMGNKRPDFILLNLAGKLIVVEIKPPKHTFKDEDYERLQNYYDALGNFMTMNPKFKEDFPNGIQIILVCDSQSLSSTESKALDLLKGKGELDIHSWETLLRGTKLAHQAFLEARAGANP